VDADWAGLTCTCRRYGELLEPHHPSEHEPLEIERRGLAEAVASKPVAIDDATIERIAARVAERPTPRVEHDVTLDEATWALFVTWLRGSGLSGQCKLSGWHRKALAGHFVTLAGACEITRIEGYKLARLARVTERAVELELGTLRRLHAFAVVQGWLVHPPIVTPLSCKAVGTRKATSKDGTVETTPEQAEKIIGLLPEHASRVRAKGARLTPIRGPFVVVYDEMLRPGQVEQLLVPKHWAPGKRDLSITADIDKNRCKRPVPLSARSVEVCEVEYREIERQGLIPVDGSNVLLFGKFKHTSRPYLKAAALKAGLPEHEAKHFSSYDFKHSGVSHLAEMPGVSLAEISALSGVSAKTLDEHYLHTRTTQARALVARRDASRASSTGADGPEDVGELAEALDGAQASDYSSGPPREGGGIGRRTSLRC
jgi:hypothetical protein